MKNWILKTTLLVSMLYCGSSPVVGQVILHTDDQASSGSNTAHNTVRDSNGNLFVLSLERTPNGEMPLIVQRSTDGAPPGPRFRKTSTIPTVA